MRIRKRRMRWGRSEIAQGVDQWIGIFLAIVICFFALQQSYGAQNMHDITQGGAGPSCGTYDGAGAGFLLDNSWTLRAHTVRTGASDRQCTDHAAECRTQRHFVGRTCKRICRECYPNLSGILPYRKHICAQPCVDHGIHTLAGWGKSF